MFVCLLCQSTALNWRRGEGFPLAQIVPEQPSVKFAREASSRTTPGKGSPIPAVKTLPVQFPRHMALVSR